MDAANFPASATGSKMLSPPLLCLLLLLLLLLLGAMQ